MHVNNVAALYQRAIILCRSVYSILRQLPGYRMFQSLRKQKPHIPHPLSMFVRISKGNETSLGDGEIGLEKSILQEGAFEPTSKCVLAPFYTPHGALCVDVTYRNQCRFEVESLVERQSRQSFENLRELADDDEEYSVLYGTSINSIATKKSS